MNKPVTPRKPVIVKPEASPERKPRVRSTKQGSKKVITQATSRKFQTQVNFDQS